MNELMNDGKRACPMLFLLCGELGLQSRSCSTPPHPRRETSRPSAYLSPPRPDAAGSLGALLATEQRASRAGGNSPRHGLRAAGNRSWGDAEIDRQIVLPSPVPRPHLSHAGASLEPLRPGGHSCPLAHGLWASASADCSFQSAWNLWQPALGD